MVVQIRLVRHYFLLQISIIYILWYIQLLLVHLFLLTHVLYIPNIAVFFFLHHIVVFIKSIEKLIIIQIVVFGTRLKIEHLITTICILSSLVATILMDIIYYLLIELAIRSIIVQIHYELDVRVLTVPIVDVHF